MRLNAGCGEFYAEGWVNIDRTANEQVRPDMIVDLREPLPFGDGEVEAVYLGHVLEHLTHTECRRLLRRLRRAMAPQAEVVAVGPDVMRAQVLAEIGQLSAEGLELVRSGGHRWEGDEHRWEMTGRKAEALFRAAGFREVVEVPVTSITPGVWPIVSHAAWQFAVWAVNP